MKYKVKNYRVGELASYYGLTSDAVRLYDRKGILSPGKNDINNYRMYTREDFVTMDYVMRMRRMELSLDDIRSILNEDSLPDIRGVIRRHESELSARISDLNKKLELLHDYEELLDICIEGFDKIEIRQLPPLICREIRDGETMAEVMDSFDMLNSPRMPLLSLTSEYATFDENVINSIISIRARESVFDYFVSVFDEDGITGDPDFPADAFSVIPPRYYLFAVGAVRTDIDYKDVLRVREYINDNGIIEDGSTIVRLVANEYSSTNSVEYMEMLIPVKELHN